MFVVVVEREMLTIRDNNTHIHTHTQYIYKNMNGCISIPSSMQRACTFKNAKKKKKG